MRLKESGHNRSFQVKTGPVAFTLAPTFSSPDQPSPFFFAFFNHPVYEQASCNYCVLIRVFNQSKQCVLARERCVCVCCGVVCACACECACVVVVRVCVCVCVCVCVFFVVVLL